MNAFSSLILSGLLLAAVPAQSAVRIDDATIMLQSQITTQSGQLWETTNGSDQFAYSRPLSLLSETQVTPATAGPATASTTVQTIANFSSDNEIEVKVIGSHSVTDLAGADAVYSLTWGMASWAFTVDTPWSWSFEQDADWDSFFPVSTFSLHTGSTNWIDEINYGSTLPRFSGTLRPGTYTVAIGFRTSEQRSSREGAAPWSAAFWSSFRFSIAEVAAVPEPSTWTTLIAGFGLIGAATRRARARNVRFA